MEAIKTVKLVRLFWSLILGLGLVLGALWALTPPSVAHAQDGEVPWMRVNYAHDWVGGNYTAGHTIWITVTNSSDDVKGTAALSSTGDGGWGGAGFETRSEHWSSGQPDIAAGDHVYFEADNGYTHAITVGTITGKVDASHDSISGTVSADFAQTLALRCEVWVESNGPDGIDTDVYPDGSTPYACAWDPISEWDILPGQDVAVMYSEPDGDRVINVFREPVPNLRVDKWVDGNGAAAPGGPVVFNIRYQNQGEGAGEAILTDTLPSNTTYAGDSSGFTAFQSGNVITWNLGTVQPYTLPHQFQLVLTNTANSGDILNVVDIGTPYDENPDDNHAQASIPVMDESPDLHVNKNVNPGDPAPGQLFRYEIDYGNNGQVAGGPVWLTDTLPASTTFVSWTSENNYSLWTAAVTTGGQVVLRAPALPGNYGDRIYLTLQLDGAVAYGTQLTNTVEITTAGDSNPDDNQYTNSDARAGAPRTNMAVEKSWGSGSLVPGGEIVYRLDYGNRGNAVAPGIVLTDTLPDGTTFITSTLDLGWGVQIPVPPTHVQGRQLTWDVGDLAVNAWPSLQLRLRVDPGTSSGTVLTNCATVSALPGDENPGDNTDCVAQTVYNHGPNLRVSKQHEWRNNNNQLHYEITFENVGDGGQIPSVVLTDTYPAFTTLAGGPGWDYWRNMSWTNNTADRQLIFRIDELDPGATAHIRFDVNLDDAGARPRWYTNTVAIDTPSGDTNPADNTYVDVAVKSEVERVELWVGQGREMWGQAAPGAPITVTTASAPFTTNADGGGNWKINNVGTITPGDVITVKAGSGQVPIVFTVPDPFTAEASSHTGTVGGQIGGAAGRAVQVHGNWDGDREVLADAAGVYSATYSSIPRGGDGEVRYVTQVDYADVIFHRDFRSPDLMLRVNYADDYDWVETQYAAGHTLWITVTNSVGDVKATMMGTTGAVPWWGDQTGFSTDMGTWSSGQLDIVPGDWVYGALDNGFTSAVRVGTIGGYLDLADDTITGTVSASFTQALALRCEVWADHGPEGISTAVYPDGSAVYQCDFSDRWPILPGQNVAVIYSEPDGDQVINIFREPAPDLRVEKWVEGNGQAFPGGPVAFNIRYQNQGQAAGEAILTDTLPSNTTYVSDSSGFDAFVSSSGVITWNLGTVPPDTLPHQFQLVLTNSAAPGDDLRNQVDIGALYDSDPGNNHAEATIHVADGRPDLSVKKNPNPGDPAPGQLFRYDINYNNNGPVASGPVWLTDTLPAGTTFVGWAPQNQPSLWTAVITTGGQVVLYAPTLPGNYGDQVRLTLRLDSGVKGGTQLTNTVEITTAADSDPSYNQYTNSDARAGAPRYNAAVDKSWGDGSLAQGHEANYWIAYHNRGNSLMHDTVLTDTLPEGVDFIASVLDQGWGVQVPFPPTHTYGRQLVWELNDQEVNAEQNIRVTMRIKSGTAPGSVLTNCATIAISDFEDDPYDNTGCTADTARASGPDLGVTKSANWESPDVIRYNVGIRNVGTSTEYNVAITDTYDFPMTPDGCSFKFGRGWQWSGCASDTNPITITLSELDPGDTAWLEMRLRVPGGVSQGTSLANTAQIDTPPGDVNPGDNSAVVVMGTGPDLSIEKRLTGGTTTPQPGDLLTYTLHFKNDSPWQTIGNVLVTDTLPAGLEFVAAQQRQCGSEGYNCQSIPSIPDPSGSVLVWHYGGLGGNWWNDLLVTARVSNTLQGGTVLTNSAEIASDDPAHDVEPNYGNNNSRYAVTVLAPNFAVTKTYTSSGIAGTVVTYTLAVSNTGNRAGSSVVLSDSLPIGLTYGGSQAGVFDGNAVTWTFASIAAGDRATAWFSGTLPCTSSTVVANDDYRVVASAEGAVSPAGAAVSLETVSPTVTTGITHTLGAILVGHTVYFTATASTNGTPLSYQWDFGQGPVGGVLTASHVYTRDGSYTAAFTATDACGYTDTATSSVTVNARPPSSVTITAPITGIVQSSYIFTATFSPAETTLPITYTWQATDQSLVIHTGGGLTNTISFAWSVTGTKTITVTAANAADIVTATHDIIVEASGNRPIYLPIIKKNSP